MATRKNFVGDRLTIGMLSVVDVQTIDDPKSIGSSKENEYSGTSRSCG